MREIKFRGWDIENKIMFSWGNLVSNRALLQSFFGNEFYAINPPRYFWERMQYIGVLTNDEKEIYEGDVCRVRGGERYQGYTEIDIIGVIKFGFGSFNLVTKEQVHYSFDIMQYDEIEILGNIYQNPELLNQ